MYVLYIYMYYYVIFTIHAQFYDLCCLFKNIIYDI